MRAGVFPAVVDEPDNADVEPVGYIGSTEAKSPVVICRR